MCLFEMHLEMVGFSTVMLELTGDVVTRFFLWQKNGWHTWPMAKRLQLFGITNV